jgi:hypothetical protein
MIKIGELTQHLSASPKELGVLVTHLDDEVPNEAPHRDSMVGRLPVKPNPYAPYTIPELYLG